jgi:hypothetical protein
MESCTNIDQRIDAAIGMICATCPDKKVQKSLQDEYLVKRAKHGNTTASAFTIGLLFDYLKETMDLTRKDSKDNETGGDDLGGRPKNYYLMEVDFLLEKYKIDIIHNLPYTQRIEAVTVLSLAYYPDKKQRELLFDEYVKQRDATNDLDAFIMSESGLFIKVADEFELTENAYMGF